MGRTMNIVRHILVSLVFVATIAAPAFAAPSAPKLKFVRSTINFGKIIVGQTATIALTVTRHILL